MGEKAIKIWLIISVCVAITAVVSTGVLATRLSSVTKTNEETQRSCLNALENSYRNNLYYLTDGIDNLQANLGKLSVSCSPELQRELLLKTVTQAETVCQSATALPVYGEDIGATVKFINQISDCCKSLLKRSGQGSSLSAEDRATLRQMNEVVSKLKSNLNAFCVKLEDILLAESIGNSELYLGNGFSSDSEQTFEYPRLIYDGPFSDARTDKTSKLSGKSFTVAQLKAKLERIFEAHGVKNVDYTTSIENKGMTLHCFTITADSVFTADVTETGGYIVQLDGYFDRDEATKTDKDNAFYLDKAQEFCKKAGYNVSPVWISKTIDGYIYVNLCPVTEQGIIIYPDLVKVVIDTQRNCIVGLEGYGYVLNHTDRELSIAADRADQALNKLSEYLTVKNTALALIPKDNREVLCYEFKCTDGESEYFVYISTDSLEEVDILNVIKGTEGYTVI